MVEDLGDVQTPLEDGVLEFDPNVYQVKGPVRRLRCRAPDLQKSVVEEVTEVERLEYGLDPVQYGPRE